MRHREGRSGNYVWATKEPPEVATWKDGKVVDRKEWTTTVENDHSVPLNTPLCPNDKVIRAIGQKGNVINSTLPIA